MIKDGQKEKKQERKNTEKQRTTGQIENSKMVA